MMKKKFRDQQESNDKDNYKPTENKDNSYNPEQNNDRNQENSVYGDEAGSASELSEDIEAAADRLVSEVKATEEKLSEMQEKYIRLSAEFDNYRKRTLREKMDLSKYAAEDLFRNIIPIMDDFERALSHMETSSDCTSMKDGIDLIYSKFSEFLKQNGIKEIESLNTNFDVDLHEAIAKVPVEEEEMKGKVVDVVQKGYYIQDKVLRFSKVVVGE